MVKRFACYEGSEHANCGSGVAPDRICFRELRACGTEFRDSVSKSRHTHSFLQNEKVISPPQSNSLRLKETAIAKTISRDAARRYSENRPRLEIRPER